MTYEELLAYEEAHQPPPPPRDERLAELAEDKRYYEMVDAAEFERLGE